MLPQCAVCIELRVTRNQLTRSHRHRVLTLGQIVLLVTTIARVTGATQAWLFKVAFYKHVPLMNGSLSCDETAEWILQPLIHEVTMNLTDVVCKRERRDESHVLFISAVVLGTIAFLAVLMRMFVAAQQKNSGYDDLFALLAACMSVPNSIGLATTAKLGLGKDIWTLTPLQITRIQKVSSPGDAPRLHLTLLSGRIYMPEFLLLVLWLSKAVLPLLLSTDLPFRARAMVVLCGHNTFDWLCRRVRLDDDLCLLADIW